jgi:transcriptional regulator with XRE-family HTH domain
MSIIRTKREEKKWTRKQLSEKLGVHEQTVVRWENGQPPTILQVAQIYRVLKINFKALEQDYINKEEVE